MFSEIRNTADSNGFRFFLIIIVLSFVVWGVGDVIRGARSRDIVFLKHTENISIEDFAKERYRILNKLEQQGQKVSPNLVQEIEQAAIQNLIKQKMVSYLQNIYEIDFSDKAALAYLKKENPDFDNTALKQHLRRNNISEEEFFAQLKHEATNKIINSSFTTGYQPQTLIKALKNYYAEADHLVVATIDLTQALQTKQAVQPSSDELQKFYEEHRARFRTEEQRNISLITINNPAILKNIKVTKAELKQYRANSPEHNNLSDAKLKLSLINDKAIEQLQELSLKIEEDIIAGDTLEELQSKFPLNIQELKNITLNNFYEYASGFNAQQIFDLQEGDIEYPTQVNSDNKKELPIYQMIAINKVIPSVIPEFNKITQQVTNLFLIDNYKKKLLDIVYYMQNNETSLATFQKEMHNNGFSISETILTRSNMSQSSISPHVVRQILEARKNSIFTDVVGDRITTIFLKDIVIDESESDKIPTNALVQFLNTQNIQEILGYAANINTPEVNTELLRQVSSAIDNN